MKHLLILLAAFFCVSCGPKPEISGLTETEYKINSDSYPVEMEEFILEFEFDLVFHKNVSRDKFIRIYFDDFRGEAQKYAGLCYRFYGNIFIDKTWWEENTCYEARKALIYHELGHCYFQWGHTDDGLMRHKMYSCDHYADNWDEMVYYYFNGDKNELE